jgi:endoglucanase
MATSISNLTLQTISYRSWDYRDELVWAAAWLYRATNDNNYLNTAESFYNEFGLQYWGGNLGWDNKVAGVQVRYVKEFTYTMSLTKQ